PYSWCDGTGYHQHGCDHVDPSGREIMYCLVINSGSSSSKFQIVDPDSSATDEPLASGLVEQIGEPQGAINITGEGEKSREDREVVDHAQDRQPALELLDARGVGPSQLDFFAVGHRVVHGGKLFSEPVLIDAQIESMIEDLIPLAPLHNPANLDGIRVAREILPDLPHVAVF